jgi:hypothetical protein
VIVHDLFPVAFRHRRVFAKIERHILRLYPGLPPAAHRVLAAAHEEPGRLDEPVGDVDFDFVNHRLAVRCLEALPLGLFGL